MVLAAGLLLADAHPFDYVPQESIAVDIVTPAEVPTAKETPSEPPKTQPTDAFSMPDDKPVMDTKPVADAKPAAAQTQAAPPSASSPSAQAPPPPATSSTASMPSVSKQAALQQPSPQPQPPPPPSYSAPEPDITVKYGVLLGLPTIGAVDAGDTGGGAAEATKADIPSMDTAEFRRHLKTCSKMPASVSRGDNIRIVLRVPFTTDGKIAAPPALIEASASAKGPALMRGAVDALVACQPYAMLPADKYDEWKVLDLSFTPNDFVGG